MRLTCPNCGAQYEVPDEVIPEEGRDVQCSNCEKTWFQPKHPETAAEPAKAAPAPAAREPEKAEAPAPAEKPAEAPKPAAEPAEAASTGNVDPAVASILKQEAAREAELRAQEGGSIETQTDLALDEPPEPEKAAKDLIATETAKDSGQNDALPDVETINSSLRSEDPLPKLDEETPPPRKSGGFRRGFILILIIGVILLLIYSNSQRISEAVPQADPVLNSYVSLVDQARVWLEAQTGTASSQN
ncbi:zinc-ribbon domain-containing protein [Ruegeria sp. R14_0]|uniref:zinc-ribbon domain-containing protein n=1 Tax=Ruegeria sp. R14_0 TaxID=2821100 RepID=UPI001ADA03C4|nr:zinc-ribbon domain-containing protein [Ruegeria sp. R14_0]MBO9445617.1 zinc-ribbon domain-containing protein [Ruegeria sp. R14_0]